MNIFRSDTKPPVKPGKPWFICLTLVLSVLLFYWVRSKAGATAASSHYYWSILCATVGIGLFLTTMYAWKAGSGKLSMPGAMYYRTKSPLVRVIVCALFGMMTALMLVYFTARLFMPYWATHWAGKPWQHTTEYYAEQWHSYPRNRRGCQYVMKIDIMRHGYYKGVCIPEETYQRIPESGTVTLHGKSSWFGVVVESFQVARE